MGTSVAAPTTQSLTKPGVFVHLQDAKTRATPIVLGVCLGILLVFATLVTLLILRRRRHNPPLIKKWKNGSEQVHRTRPTQVITHSPTYEDTSRTFDTSINKLHTGLGESGNVSGAKRDTSSQTRAIGHQRYDNMGIAIATVESVGADNASAGVYDDLCSGPAHNRQDVAEEGTYDHLQVRNFQLHGGRAYPSSSFLPPAQVCETCTDLTNQDDTYSHLVKPIGSHAPPVMISAKAAVETQARTDEPVYSLITEAVEGSYSQPADFLPAPQQLSIRRSIATNQGDEYSQPADPLLVDKHMGTTSVTSISQCGTYSRPADSLLVDKRLGINGALSSTSQSDTYSQPADSLLDDQHLGINGALSSTSQSGTYSQPADSLLDDQHLGINGALSSTSQSGTYSQPADSLLDDQHLGINGALSSTSQSGTYSQPADSLLDDQHLGTTGATSTSQSDTYIEPADSLLGDKQLNTRGVRTSCLRRCVQANTAAVSNSSLQNTSQKLSSTFRQAVDGVKTREKGVGTNTGAITGGRTSTDDMPTSTVGKVPLHDSCADAATAVNNVYSQPAEVLAEPTGGPMRCHRVSRVANIPPTLPINADIVTTAISEASSTDYLIRSDMAITSALASSAPKSSQAKENDIHGNCRKLG